MSPLSLCNVYLCLLLPFLAWSIFFPEMRVATPTLLCVPFAWNIIFHPFTFSLFFSLEWRWVFDRQRIIGSFFFFNQPSYSLSFGWLINLLIMRTWFCHFTFFSFLYISIVAFSLCFYHQNYQFYVFYKIDLSFLFFMFVTLL